MRFVVIAAMCTAAFAVCGPAWAAPNSLSTAPMSAQPAYVRFGIPLKPPKHGGVYVAAHRGAHQGIPENTLPAYQKAIDLGADFVEVDLRTTRDNKLVLSHNASINEYTNGKIKGNVRDLTLAQLRSIDIGSRVGPQFKGVTFPTFQELINLCKGKIGIYLDFKDANIDRVAKIIEDNGMQHDVIWYLNDNQIRKYLELHRVAPLCLPMVDPGPEKNLAALIQETHPNIVASDLDDYSKSFVQTCHNARAIAIVDVLPNKPELWQQALDWHTDGIQTDFPAQLIAWLDAHGKKQATK